MRRLLFDTGITPDGCAGNLRRLGQDPADIEAIVCSHGHFDHTTGLSGLIGRLGRANLPVLIHPEFWARRRLAIPGEPFELPTTSRRALEDAGFGIIEQRQPSFLYDRSVLACSSGAQAPASARSAPGSASPCSLATCTPTCTPFSPARIRPAVSGHHAQRRPSSFSGRGPARDRVGTGPWAG